MKTPTALCSFVCFLPIKSDIRLCSIIKKHAARILCCFLVINPLPWLSTEAVPGHSLDLTPMCFAFLSQLSLCCAVPTHFRNNYMYFCESAQKPPTPPPLPPPPLTISLSRAQADIHCVCVFACSKCMQCSQRVGSLCPGVRDLLLWLMGFQQEALQGAIHNHWARPQSRQACPSHEEKRRERREGGEGEGEKKIFPCCPLLSLSFPLSIHPAFSLQKPPTSTTPLLSSPSPLSSVQLTLWSFSCTFYTYSPTLWEECLKKHTHKQGGRFGRGGISAVRKKR